MNEDEISVSQAAEILGIGYELAADLARAGVLPGVHSVLGGGVSVYAEEVRATVRDLPRQIREALRRHFDQGFSLERIESNCGVVHRCRNTTTLKQWWLTHLCTTVKGKKKRRPLMTKSPWLTRTIALTLKGYKWQGGTAIVVDRRTARCDHVKAAACLWCDERLRARLLSLHAAT
mgnify:CR=1 FL=1